MVHLDALSIEKKPRISDMVDYWAEERENKICLLEGDKKSYTYSQLKEEVDSLAGGLLKLGISKGNVVLTMLENSLNFVESWLAINKLGAIDVPVHTAYKASFIQHIINTTGARYIIVNSQHINTVQDALADISEFTLIVVGETTFDKNALPAGIEVVLFNNLKVINPTLPEVIVKPDDIANILFTSGTKSGTQGLILTNQIVRNQMLSVVRNMSLNENDVAYVCVPMSHGNGKFAQVGVSLMLGASAVIIPKFSASQWIYDVHHYNITYTTLMGPMAEFVYKQPTTDYDFENDLRVVLNVPRHPDFTPKFEKRFGIECIEVYGQASMASAIRSSIGIEKNYASCGKLIEDLWDARIVDPVTGLDMENNHPGELWLRPKKEGIITPGYYNDAESFALAFHGEWYATGDLLQRDDEGYYYFIGRTGDFIRRRGENISAQEVETAIKSVAGVKDAVVIGVPTEFSAGEEDVMAILEGESIDFDIIIKHCEEELPYFAVPRYWLFRTLPCLSDNSIDKEVLKKSGVTPDTFDREK